MAGSESSRSGRQERSHELAETHVPGSDLAFEPTAAPIQTGEDALEPTVLTPPGGKPQPEAAAHKQKPKRLGDFEVLKKLGQGGMGVVYLARQVSLDRLVALKTLARDYSNRPDLVQRFLRECRAMARLQHPNAVQVYAADSAAGVHFVAIEYVDGRSLQKWMNKLGRLNVGDALHVILAAADAIQHAHEINLVHRDIKPDNILVTSKGVVKVADFGLAKVIDEDTTITHSGAGLGTPRYMAPEQARDAKRVDRRSDVYALGITLYYFLTGELPFQGDTAFELITAKERGKFTPARKRNPNVPERLDLMIDKMIAKDPAHRYAGCDGLIADLESLHLDNATLSFIDAGAGTAAPRTSSRRTRAGGTANSPTMPLPPSDRETGRRKSATGQKQWYVEHTNARGQRVISRMSTAQIQTGIQTGMLDLQAKAKRRARDAALPLAQYPEFESLIEKRIVKERSDARAQDLKDIYTKIDRQDRRRRRWRWFKGKLESFVGSVLYVVYLGLLCSAVYGVYLAVRWAFPLVAAQLGLDGFDPEIGPPPDVSNHQ